MIVRERLFLLIACLVLVCACSAAQDGQQQFADLGDLKLHSGEILRDCRIGYRTFGKPEATKANVILFPTWAGGTTEQLSGSIGPGKLADSSKYFVIAVDALSNGVSSSPANSTAQPRMHFPKITIRDMVESQYRLLTEKLGIHHVMAVMGISMGGMQTFQWMVSYPEFMDKAIPIVGSPRLAAYDLVLWQAQIDSIMNDRAWNNGDYRESPAKVSNAEFGALILTTPQHYNAETTREKALQSLSAAKSDSAYDANNHIRQDQAMMALDVSDAFAGSMEKAAASVKAKVLVVVALQDHTVTPGPALEFSQLIRAEVLTLNDECGHQLMSCENDRVVSAVAEFLKK
jgi:homoserine O-acetyltransferase